MTKQKVYIAPSAKRGSGYSSRYFPILKEKLSKYYDVLEADNRECLMQGGALLRNSLISDVFILSFVETIAFQKLALLQSLMAVLSLKIIKFRKKNLVYIFHNIRPHKGETRLSKWLTEIQLKQATLVLTHSADAAEYAKNVLMGKGLSPLKVKFICHPIADSLRPVPGLVKGSGILIWGDILPYKGIVEFLSMDSVKKAGLSIRILGQCKDKRLLESLQNLLEEYGGMPTQVVFENRRASFDELAKVIGESRYVLFPYLPGTISGSGALMDTIGMGGIPVGPSVGAFLDLSKQGQCVVYNDSGELPAILATEPEINRISQEQFVKEHTWDAFVDNIFTFLSSGS